MLNPCLAFAVAVLMLALLNRAAFAQDEWEDDWEEDTPQTELHGFVELATAFRFDKGSAAADELLLSEARFRLDVSHIGSVADVSVKADFMADGVTDDNTFDLRQAYVTVRAAGWLNIRAGRQALTWGTGDFVFLNDLFPKDFVSFFAGRDDEFLKAPANALKATLSSGAVNLDIVWLPVFTPDRFISGERLSFFQPGLGAIVGPATLAAPVEALLPARTLGNGEFFARLYRSLGSVELALYGSLGYFKQPTAFDTASGLPTYAGLASAGASARMPLLGGLAHAEAAYYHSREDSEGDRPFIPNSQLRALLGYERELIANLTAGLQYYLEQRQDYDALLANSPFPDFEAEENRQWITLRLSLRLLRHTLRVSAFGFYSLEDDYHIRLSGAYQWSDNLAVSLGALIMQGDEHSFFGGLQDNTNAFLRLRYGF